MLQLVPTQVSDEKTVSFLRDLNHNSSELALDQIYHQRPEHWFNGHYHSLTVSQVLGLVHHRKATDYLDNACNKKVGEIFSVQNLTLFGQMQDV